MPGMPLKTSKYTLVSLEDAKSHLRYPANDISDDSAIMGFIYAVTDIIRAECGDVVPVDYDEYYDGGDFALNTRHTPILEVYNVEEGWGWTNYDLTYVQVNSTDASSIFAYSIDEPSVGLISRRSGGNVNIPFMHGTANIRVTYSAGLSAIPPILRLAALELIAHYWQGSQQRADAGMASTATTSGSSYDTVSVDFTRSQGVTSLNYGIPIRVVEMLKPYRKLPYIG